MPTAPSIAFIGSTGATVRLDGETLIVQPLDQTATILPIGLIGGVVSVGAVEWTTGALLSLADPWISCCFRQWRRARASSIDGAINDRCRETTCTSGARSGSSGTGTTGGSVGA